MLMNLKKDTSYKIIIEKNPDHFLKKLNKQNQKELKKLLKLIHSIPSNPYNSKSLLGKFQGLRRVKKGDYRIVFMINNKVVPHEIRILDIGKRKNVYK